MAMEDIEQAMDVDQLLLDLYVKRNRLTLPTLPEVAERVRQHLNKPNTTAAQLAKLINTDPALSAKLLQVANSPLYRGRDTIESVQGAVARLGNNIVRELVSTFAVRQLFNKRAGNGAARALLKQAWAHSVRVAAISAVLAKRFPSLSSERAMLAGLMHDIGTLPIIARTAKTPELLDDTPTLLQIAATLHTELGKLILESWNFPPVLVAVAAEHEDLSRDTGDEVDYVDIVMVANLHSHLGTEHNLAHLDWTRIPAFRKLGLGPDESINAMNEARQDILEIQNLLTAGTGDA